MGTSSDRVPVTVHILGGRGLVWDADDALWLRSTCGLVGAMVGGVAAFKQQNSVHGLPLELSQEEVALALQRGWAVLEGAAPAERLALAPPPGAGAAALHAGSKRPRQLDDPYTDDDEDVDYEAAGVGAGAGGEDGGEGAPRWRAALAEGGAYVVPTLPHEAEGYPGDAGGGGCGGGAAAADGGAAPRRRAPLPGAAPPRWAFPATRAERARLATFADLHGRGYRLTGGSKFGADFLAYPGDPCLYHAQFCVRVAPAAAPLAPPLLAAALRGSFQARKHLLLASVVGGEGEGETPRVEYVTLGPVDGFG